MSASTRLCTPVVIRSYLTLRWHHQRPAMLAGQQVIGLGI